MNLVLVATDGSEGADRAIAYAAHRARDAGAELLIVNVVGGYGLPEKVLIAFTNDQSVLLKELLESESAQTLAAARDRTRKAGAGTILLESRRGEVAQKIIDIAREKKADAIVVGKRGAGRVEGALLGSVSQKLVVLSPLSYAVVSGQAERADSLVEGLLRYQTDPDARPAPLC